MLFYVPCFMFYVLCIHGKKLQFNGRATKQNEDWYFYLFYKQN